MGASVKHSLQDLAFRVPRVCSQGKILNVLRGDREVLPKGDCEALPTGDCEALPTGDRIAFPTGDCAALPTGDRS
ncbi:hypothetical protein CEP10_16420 [Cylindrospermopsis raciborskii S07]|uniref:hypothetical protein n=1 Tax=Cylindrospermopsis raciborskii TaxID=77022 RepID=UPI000C9EBDEB|nr:hypothetical protein [Cylindrospermopsis raciborskii]PNK02539.1 hypothetical protein CEP10_16420 [Cylindrospermopsis raciborskii S07]PNK05928.1 hypothetical protein CEP12_10010 [Cylindrospermopsis raciborskii S14]PNK09753.1 hypothetical protein CEP09_18515 [Cylindrospermopsis raciborskii S06]PNK16390.1 hypothetical protein CEP08_11025 [Cylindrospermopsis raciborskii S05]